MRDYVEAVGYVILVSVGIGLACRLMGEFAAFAIAGS